MTKINPQLLAKLIKKMNVGQARVYRVIQQRSLDSHVDSHVASLLVARDNGVNYQPYATAEDRVEIRPTRRGQGVQLLDQLYVTPDEPRSSATPSPTSNGRRGATRQSPGAR